MSFAAGKVQRSVVEARKSVAAGMKDLCQQAEEHALDPGNHAQSKELTQSELQPALPITRSQASLTMKTAKFLSGRPAQLPFLRESSAPSLSLQFSFFHCWQQSTSGPSTPSTMLISSVGCYTLTTSCQSTTLMKDV